MKTVGLSSNISLARTLMLTVISVSILEDLRKLDNEICIGSGYWTSERYPSSDSNRRAIMAAPIRLRFDAERYRSTGMVELLRYLGIESLPDLTLKIPAVKSVVLHSILKPATRDSQKLSGFGLVAAGLC